MLTFIVSCLIEIFPMFSVLFPDRQLVFGVLSCYYTTKVIPHRTKVCNITPKMVQYAYE